MITKHSKLALTCLSPAQHEQTCAYWYTLTSNGTAYTAFRTRASLEFFLDIHHLTLSEPLPDTLGEHAYIPVDGEVRSVMHSQMEDMPLEGRRMLQMSNGDHTLGLVTQDAEGSIVHYMGPNAERMVFDHAQARAHVDAGHVGPMEAMI